MDGFTTVRSEPARSEEAAPATAVPPLEDDDANDCPTALEEEEAGEAAAPGDGAVFFTSTSA